MEPTPRPSNQNLASESALRIVLVEDNPAQIHLLRLALDLQARKYQLHELRDGARALQYIQEYRKDYAEDPEPSVMVLDMHLPKHDGPTVLRALKRHPALSHIPVVILTTSASPSEETEVRELGIRLYREKPTDIDELTRVAREIIDICNEKPTTLHGKSETCPTQA